MALVRAFGSYLPPRRVSNEELAASIGCESDWISSVSGIRERRVADDGESVADLAAHAARDCLARAGLDARNLGAVIVSSGSADRRFPGPASAVAQRLGLEGAPAIDVPVASAGSLFGMALADSLAAQYGDVLVVAAERMFSAANRPPIESKVAVLFGDGAGACLVSRDSGFAEIRSRVLHSDGNYADDLRLEWDKPVEMNGHTVIMQAARKIPAAIRECLTAAGLTADHVAVFLAHQANQNLIDKVAQALRVSRDKFYTNIDRYGNTSSASMLIAAAEWRESGAALAPGDPIVFAAFGAGFHWGAIAAVAV